MALQKGRTRISVKGLGTLSVRETSPSAGTTFDEVGALDGETGTVIEDFSDVEEIVAETGNLEDVKEKSRIARFSSNLLQTSIDEINLNKQSGAKTHALRYYGKHSDSRFQYFCIPKGRINPGVALGFKQGKRVLPFRAWALKQSDLTYDYPEYHIAETKGEIRIKDLQLWVNPRNIYAPERGTSKLFDISGWERHGTLNSNFTAIWQTGTPESFLRFLLDNGATWSDLGTQFAQTYILSLANLGGGVVVAGTAPNGKILRSTTAGNVYFGDILNDDGISDFCYEMFFKITGENATQQILFAKKQKLEDHSAGYVLYRDIDNKLKFKISDGTASVIISSASTILKNIYYHAGIAIDRNGNGQLYINGTINGGAASVASIGSAQNNLNFQFGQTEELLAGIFECGTFRYYKYGAGNIPSDIATIVNSNYNAEKSYYGL